MLGLVDDGDDLEAGQTSQLDGKVGRGGRACGRKEC